ncbi:protoheme IX farnesyltransferase, partial [Vibrio sp. F13]|uniref:UbiA family prenyltransferase n=2 Tax=Vibrio TaxID=662 RepID=UPI00113EAB28
MVSRTSTQYEVVAQDAALTHKITANNDITLSNEKAEKNKATWKVYLTLTKPKVVALMLLTALVGMCLAVPNGLPLQQTLFGMIGIGLMAGSAAAFNHLIDKKIDGQMTRTNRRPLPSGELSSVRVFSFAAGIGLFGFATLVVWVNQLTAWLTFASLLGYAVIYTMYL